MLLLLGRESGPSRPIALSGARHRRNEGAPPPVDLAAERRAGDFVRGLIRDGKVTAVHDVSDGGLLVAVAEMALGGRHRRCARGAASEALPAHAIWFGEDQGRYVAAASPETVARILQDAAEAGVPARVVGKATGDALKLAGEAPLPLHALRAAQERWLPELMTAKID